MDKIFDEKKIINGEDNHNKSLEKEEKNTIINKESNLNNQIKEIEELKLIIDEFQKEKKNCEKKK